MVRTASLSSYLFINSKSGQIPKQSRADVRSHVMRGARRQRTWSTCKIASKSRVGAAGQAEGSSEDDHRSGSDDADMEDSDPSSPSSWPSSTQGRISIVATELSESGDSNSSQPLLRRHIESDMEESVQLSRRSASSPLGLDNMLDPFCSLPVQLDPSARWMLDQYFSKLSQCMAMGGQTNISISWGWFAASFTSRAFLYSILCAAATHMYTLSQTTYVTVLQYMAQAMSDLNATLADPQTCVTDGSIGAVFNLLCVTETFPLARDNGASIDGMDAHMQRSIHLQGLKRMVALRGGLPSLRTNRYLYSLLLWHSTAHSIASFKPSEFYLEDEVYDRLIREQYQSKISWTSNRRMLDLMDANHLPNTLLSTVEHIRDLRYQVEASFRMDRHAPEFLHLTNFSSLIVQHLLNFISTPLVGSGYTAKAMAIALLMFTARAARGDPVTPVDPLHFNATGWLRHALIASYCEPWDAELRLWACTIGSICSQGSKDADDIEHAFIFACHQKGIGSAEQLEGVLEGLLWMGARFSDGLHELWAKLQDSLVIKRHGFSVGGSF